MRFNELNLSATLLANLEREGYETPTPVQSQSIPPVLEGRDLLASAQTGTGKTAAFALPILQMLAGGPRRSMPLSVKALVLTPTRELAVQIGESFETYGKNLYLKTTVIYGGVGYVPQKDALRRGVDVLVATPGRLLDLLEQRAVILSGVSIFTLDEADRMLDMGFIRDVRKIAALLPDRRQTLLFSATMPDEIRELADSLLSDPVRVQVAAVSAVADNIDQRVYFVEKADKQALLHRILEDSRMDRVLVFTRTKHGADRVCRGLSRSGITAEAIHGNKTQSARLRSLDNFRRGVSRVLVATDVASRGIDIDEISHVVNFELPDVPETYVHRIGRTARAGASGISVSFCDGRERGSLKAIERLLRRPLEVRETPAGAELALPASGRRPMNEHDGAGRNERRERGSRSGSQKRRGGRGRGRSKTGNSERAPAASGGGRHDDDAGLERGPRRRGERYPDEASAARNRSGRGERPARSPFKDGEAASKMYIAPQNRRRGRRR
ncbi:MAG TPA: DEAD/DEAH box helicase [Spirochaetia bacterium]|nr:DEAD/DEAH box helicase [Spirochaetia bacterium]